VETPPSRPGDDGLDPFRHSAATIAPLLYPRPRRRIETKAGRSAMTATTCTGSNARSPTLPSVSKPLQYAPATSPAERGSVGRWRDTRLPPARRPSRFGRTARTDR
jgi:hypothetical protein